MRPNLKPVSHQTIVITGATSGIGLATAELAAAQGAKLVLVARNADALAEIAARLQANGAPVVTLAADIADEATAPEIVKTAVGAFGGFDTWVNDAVAAEVGRLTDTPLDDLRRIFDVGYFGLVNASLQAVRHLRGKGGALINVGSVLSERAMIYQGGYSSMKHAVKGFTDALRMELAVDAVPVSVTLIKPTGINTMFAEHARNRMEHNVRIPSPIYDPRLVARAIVWAAANPKRELTVGGTGLAISKGGNLFPSLTDWGMERIGDAIQTEKTPPASGTTDNLNTARVDGRIDSNQDRAVRHTSLYLEAQMHPWLTTGLFSLATMAGIAVAKRVSSPGFKARSEKQGGPSMKALADGRRR